MKVLGIDVGLSGALAVYDTATGCLDAIDMPVTGEGTKRRVNAAATMRWIKIHHPDRAFIELVNAMPSIADPDHPEQERRGMGSASAFRFGDSFGSVRTVVVCCEIPFTLVVPRVWKRSFGIVGSDKELSRQKAIDLFPVHAELFERKRDERRAEAALISRYGADTLGLFA